MKLISPPLFLLAKEPSVVSEPTMSNCNPVRAARWHWFVGTAVGLVCAMLVCGGCENEPTFDGVIVGGSMAPHLLGEHFFLVCDDCGYGFPADMRLPKQSSFACANCGFSLVTVPLEETPADIVKVQLESEFRRWDIVAIRRKGETEASIKRIVGLPGEVINIDRGDVFCKADRVVKPLSIQKQLFIPVHDTNFRSRMNIPERWRPVAEESGWKIEGSEFQFVPSSKSIESESGLESESGAGAGSAKATNSNTKPDSANDNDWDWIRYHHWRGFHHNRPRIEEFPVEDSYGFNQAINRNVVPMNDLYLCVDAVVRDPKAELLFNVNFFEDSHKLEVSFTDQTVVYRASTGEEQSFSWNQSLTENVFIEISTVDSTLRFQIDGFEVLSIRLIGDRAQPPAKYPFSIGAKAGKIELRRMQIFRDVYYRSLNDSPRGGTTLGSDEYYLLGDNVPLSIDSRHWENPAVSKSEILGTVNAEQARPKLP